MTFEEVTQKFIDNNCYLSNGAGLLSNKWGVPKDIIKAARISARQIIKDSTNCGIENEPTKEVQQGKLKSKWFNGKTWCESYAYSEVEDETNLLDNIEEILNRVLKNNKPEKVNINEINQNRLNLNIYLSDQHIGASVEHSLYSNYFDGDIYINRMHKVFKWIVQKAQLVGGFDNITIFYLGDTFDGQDGFTVKRTHDLPQNMSNEEAFELGLDVNMKFLNRVFKSGLGAKYNVYFVRESNHGGSMDYYLFKSLETWIKTISEDVDCTIAKSFLDHTKIADRTFIYTHGKDNKDMKSGLPLNLNDKTENFINQYIYENNIKGNISTVKGDLHQDGFNGAKLFTYRNVPSLFGSSKWIMSNFGITKPGVGWDMFDDKDELFGGVIRFN